MKLTKISAIFACTALALTACSSSDPEPTEDDTHDDHAEIDGADEVPEAQYRLVVADDSGQLAVLNLLEETVEHVDLPDAASGLSTDGRFAYARGESGLHVVDSGVWTWPHGDHNHYYVAPIANLGTVDVGPGHVNGTIGSDTALFDDETGEALTLNRDALDDGELDTHEWSTTEPHHGFALAIDDHILATTVSGDGLPDGLSWYDSEGNVEDLDIPCGEMHGTARHGDLVIAACDDGALLVDGDSVDLVEYPDGTTADDRAWSFSQRPGSTELGAVRGDDGAWLFDVSERTWQDIDIPNPVAVSALGADQGILVLDEGGTLHHVGADGDPIATLELIDDLNPEHAPTVVVDPNRAYVNDLATGEIHEIDYADELRLARTLDPEIDPEFMVGTGWLSVWLRRWHWPLARVPSWPVPGTDRARAASWSPPTSSATSCRKLSGTKRTSWC